MPRLKVDGKRVVEHRITLGTYERDQLDTLVTGLTAKNALGGAASILGNPYALASTVALLEALGVIDIRKFIKNNSSLDEWYNSLLGGAFGTYDAAVSALDAAIDVAKEIGDFVDDPVGYTVAKIKAATHFQPSGMSPQETQMRIDNYQSGGGGAYTSPADVWAASQSGG